MMYMRFPISVYSNLVLSTCRQVLKSHLLDVVVRESAAVLQLLRGEDQALLAGGDP